MFFVCGGGGAGKKAGGEVPAGSVFSEYHYIQKRGGEKKGRFQQGSCFRFSGGVKKMAPVQLLLPRDC